MLQVDWSNKQDKWLFRQNYDKKQTHTSLYIKTHFNMLNNLG